MKNFIASLIVATAVLGASWSAATSAAETVRIAWVDPLSGPMAALGQNELDTWRYVVDLANREKWAGDTRFEVVPFDNRLSTAETLSLFSGTLVDRDIRFIAQGNSSSAGIALIGAIDKYNERNPGREVMYLNYVAADPDMTNKYCSYWQFRFDAHSGMKMLALITSLSKNAAIRKVYLINQNYSHGQTSAVAAREFLAKLRPDVEIVGEDLHPLGAVKDFAPYVAKIAASHADAVVTANWGGDLALLARAMHDYGVDVPVYNFFTQNVGVPTAMGSAALQRAQTISVFNPNSGSPRSAQVVTEFKQQYKEDFFVPNAYFAVAMLAKAIRTTGSTDVKTVAAAMEGISVDGFDGPVAMRATDHQIQLPLYLTTWVPLNGKDIRFDQEGTGLGLRTDAVIAARDASLPTTCQMKRPT